MSDNNILTSEDIARRVKEKQASRDEDERMLRDGEITAAELRKRNGVFAQLLCRPDFAAARMK